jgi:hypothetical protein
VPIFTDIAHLQRECCFFIHSPLGSLQFPDEILVMDDTFSASHFELPLVAIIVEDWEA